MALSLVKGQNISLNEDSGQNITKVIMGLGWDAIKDKKLVGFDGMTEEIDLDASCLMFGDQQNIIDIIWFRQRASLDGSVIHHGDNRTGDGDGDDEQITVDLSKIPPEVKHLMFLVTSFTGQDFSEIDNATCRMVNAINNQEIARYNLTTLGYHTAQIMAKVYRHEDSWKFQAIGEVGNGRTFNELIPQMTRLLKS